MARAKTHLLVAHDLGNSAGEKKRNAALQQYSNALAKKLDASITLVHAENLNPFSVQTGSYKAVIDHYVKSRENSLASFKREYPSGTKTQFVNGDPVSSLLKVATREKSEMIILGTHGRTGVTRLLLGSVTEEVMRQSRIPVLAIGPKSQSTKADFSKTSLAILMPTSLTQNSARAEKYASELAKKLGAKIIFFHSLREAMHPALQTAFSSQAPSAKLQSYWEELKSKARKDLARRVDQAKSRGLVAEFILDDQHYDSAEGVLKEISRSKADLVVMGTHGRSMMGGMFFGRTAREVVLSSPAPVITVRSKGA